MTLSLQVLRPSDQRGKLSSELFGGDHRIHRSEAVRKSCSFAHRRVSLPVRPECGPIKSGHYFQNRPHDYAGHTIMSCGRPVTSPFAACRGRIQLGSPDTSPTAEDDRVGYQGDAGIGRVGLLFSLIGPVQSISSRRLIQLRASARRRAGRFPVSSRLGLGGSFCSCPPQLAGGFGRRPLSIPIARCGPLPPRARDTAGVEALWFSPRPSVSAGQSFHDPERGFSDLLPVVTSAHAFTPHLNCPRAVRTAKNAPLRDLKLNTSVPLNADQFRLRGVGNARLSVVQKHQA